MKFVSLDNLTLFYGLMKEKLSNQAIAGFLNMTSSDTVSTLKEKALSMEVGDMAFYFMSDSITGVSTSSSVTFESSVAQFVSQSPYTVVLNQWVGTGTKNTSLGASVGDLLAVIKTKVSGVTTYVFKVVPVNDAKAASGDFPGCDGLETIWDKTQVNKVPTLAAEVKNLNAGRSYAVGTEKNIDRALNPGIYPSCTTGRSMSGNHTDETYTVVVESSYNNNTNLWNVRQWAYSDNYPCRAFYRVVQTSSLSNYNGTYGEWNAIGQDNGTGRTYYMTYEIEDYSATDLDIHSAVMAFVAKFVNGTDYGPIWGFRGTIDFVKDSKYWSSFVFQGTVSDDQANLLGMYNGQMMFVGGSDYEPQYISELKNEKQIIKKAYIEDGEDFLKHSGNSNPIDLNALQITDDGVAVTGTNSVVGKTTSKRTASALSRTLTNGYTTTSTTLSKSKTSSGGYFSAQTAIGYSTGTHINIYTQVTSSTNVTEGSSGNGSFFSVYSGYNSGFDEYLMAMSIGQRTSETDVDAVVMSYVPDSDGVTGVVQTNKITDSKIVKKADLSTDGLLFSEYAKDEDKDYIVPTVAESFYNLKSLIDRVSALEAAVGINAVATASLEDDEDVIGAVDKPTLEIQKYDTDVDDEVL